MIKYSFIIPVKEINNYIWETVSKILQIERQDFEIIIYPDVCNSDSWEKTKQIATGHIGPAEKRTLAIKDAVGEILIFIDDDAYPEQNFLDILDKDFTNEELVAVGGPAITPDNDSFWQKVSGAVFLSSFSGGFPERYISVGEKKFVDDWPSVNFSIRKNIFIEVGGFNCKFWPGEDTKLCLDVLESGSGKIWYDPDLIVYHHRREGLLKHLKQIGGYGLHRGYFARVFPETSLKFKYFLPTLFLLFVVVGLVGSFLSTIILKLYLLGWFVYFLVLIKILFDTSKYVKMSVALAALYYVFFTHLYYGLRFIQGLATKELKSQLR